MTRNTIIQAKKGDGEAINSVISEYEPLIRHIVRTRNYGVYYDDYVQAGMIGLLNAIEKEPENSDSPFKPFASMYIRKEIWRLTCEIQGMKHYEYALLRKYHKKKQEIENASMYEPDMNEVINQMKLRPSEIDIIKSHATKALISIDEDDAITKKFEKGEEEDTLNKLQDGREYLLKGMIESLTDKQKSILKAYYYEGLSPYKIADSLSISVRGVTNTIKAINKKMFKQWPAQLFAIAFENPNFTDPNYNFHEEKWVEIEDGKYSVSNYGRVRTYHSDSNKLKIVKPYFERTIYRYYFKIGDKTIKKSAPFLIDTYFTIDDLPTFYEK